MTFEISVDIAYTYRNLEIIAAIVCGMLSLPFINSINSGFVPAINEHEDYWRIQTGKNRNAFEESPILFITHSVLLVTV
jgi:hypothetical protein